MTPFVFDTLSASKQLREAGMAEGVAEAVVSVFQHASATPDISHLATKADLDALSVATKADLEALSVATKADIADMATKSDLKAQLEMLRHDMRAGFADVRAEVSEKLRQQALLLLGGITALVTLLNVSLKILG